MSFRERISVMETLLIYILGAGLYGLIEIIWRGWTHWTMLLCGGACFTCMYVISAAAIPLWAKCLISAAVITAVEFCTGFLVNIIFGWHVWDYSDRPLNIMGQVCPLFSFFWLLLSIPGLALCSGIRELLV